MSDITANVVVTNPRPIFTDSRTFRAVSNGRVYIGQIDTDPVNPSNQIPVYIKNESGELIQISQPLIINSGGKIVYNGQLVKVVTSQGHSMAVYDSYGVQVDYIHNVMEYDPAAQSESVPLIYKKVGVFGDNGTVNSKNDVVKYSDGLWYRYNGLLPFSYGDSPDQNWTCVGFLNGYNLNSPENFGAITDAENYDCLASINLAIKTGCLYLSPGKTYFVSSEVVIPSGLSMITNGATVKAISAYSWSGKSVIRASKKPVGTSPDLTKIDEQVRGLRHVGSLNVDANNVAPYGFYGFGVVAESITDSIYAYNATEVGIVLLGSWYHKVGLYMGINCARGVSIAYGFSGETGDINVNAVSFGAVSAYDTTRSISNGYDPHSSNISQQLIGAGVVLGQGLASRIETLTAENIAGTGFASVNAVNWSVGSMYFETCSKSLTPSIEPDIAMLSTTGNVEDHTFDICNIHFGINTGILHRSESAEIFNIQSIYRLDNKKTWHSGSKSLSSYAAFVNYYVLNPYNYIKPKQIINDAGKEVISDSNMLVFKDFSNTPNLSFIYTGGEMTMNVTVSEGSVIGAEFQVGSEDGIEYITCTSSPYTATLTKKRNSGSYYKISLATPAAAATGKGSVIITKQKISQWIR